MDESIKILPNFKKFNSYIDDVKQGISPIMLSGLTDVAKIHFAYSIFLISLFIRFYKIAVANFI